MDDANGDIISLDLDDRISSAPDVGMNTQIEDANIGSATPLDEISDADDLIPAPLPQSGGNSVLDINIDELSPFESRLRDLLFAVKAPSWTSHAILKHSGSPFINIKSRKTVIPLPIPENQALKDAIFSSLAGGVRTPVISFKSNDIELLDPSLQDEILEALQQTHLRELGFPSRMQWSLELDQLWLSNEKGMVTIIAGRDPSIIARVVVLFPSCFQGRFRIICKHDSSSKSFQFKPISEASTKARILVTYGSTDFNYNPPDDGVVTWLTFNVRFQGPAHEIPPEPSMRDAHSRLRKHLLSWPLDQGPVFVPLSPESTLEQIAVFERPFYQALLSFVQEGIVQVQTVELHYTFEGQTQNQLQEDDTYYNLLKRKDYKSLMEMNHLTGEDALALEFLEGSDVVMTVGSLNGVVPVYNQMSVYQPYDAETEAEFVTFERPIALRQHYSIFALKISRVAPSEEEELSVPYSSAPKRRKIV
eukprot:TRINITY_DN13430_c0_g1_i1.p1 TRINITY_DN13430_c0_g1~~TRINITY_DN13430_c0_g1_i1.p1  ORF type:complete len:484 (+),score=50.41 TRINITY_DN13430_c0_g1_i1:22-1452(+)